MHIRWSILSVFRYSLFFFRLCLHPSICNKNRGIGNPRNGQAQHEYGTEEGTAPSPPRFRCFFQCAHPECTILLFPPPPKSSAHIIYNSPGHQDPIGGSVAPLEKQDAAPDANLKPLTSRIRRLRRDGDKGRLVGQAAGVGPRGE